jgi:hypothetical protein
VNTSPVPRTKIPKTGNYCADCHDHEHTRFDAHGRCIDCFDHQHTSARPVQSFWSWLGLAPAQEYPAGKNEEN